MNEPRITATAVRKAARKLGDDHPAVLHWRSIASQRVAQINNADAAPGMIPSTGRVLADDLEAAKWGVIKAAAEATATAE